MQIFLESYGQIERKFSRVTAIWFFAQFTFFGHMITCAKNQTIANIYLLYLGCTLTIQKCKFGWFAQEIKILCFLTSGINDFLQCLLGKRITNKIFNFFPLIIPVLLSCELGNWKYSGTIQTQIILKFPALDIVICFEF